MAKLTTVTARIDSNLKESAEAIFKKFGITHSQAINMLYSIVVLRKALPFDLHLGEDETSDIITNPNLMGQIAESLKTYEAGSGNVVKEELNAIDSLPRSNARRIRKVEKKKQSTS